MKKYRLLVAAGVMMGLMTGCGSEAEVSQKEPVETTETTKQPTQNETTKEETTKQETTVETQAKTVQMANGEMPIPEETDSFAVLEMNVVDNFIALGHSPVAASMLKIPTEESKISQIRFYEDGMARVFEEGQLEGFEFLPTKVNGEFEQLVGLDLDFIVASESASKYLEQLTAIAPTYIIPSTYEGVEPEDTWKETHQLIGTLLGEETLAKQQVDTFNEVAADYKAQIKEQKGEQTALILQLNAKGFKIRNIDSHPEIYKELGLVLPDGIDDNYVGQDHTNESGSFPIETLIQFDPDYIFIDIQSPEVYNEIKDTPVWQGLKAVKNAQVFENSQYVWDKAMGPVAKTTLIKDAAEFVLNKTHVTTRPYIVD